MRSEKRILMVDDKVTLCFAMREYFKLFDCEVDCAHNADEAAERLNTSRYAVVIADLDLGGTHDLSGFKVIKMVQEKCPETRVIVLTAYGSAEVEADARKLGTSVFLNKPKPLSEVARIVFELAGDEFPRGEHSESGSD